MQRDLRIDALRGVAILLVVHYHYVLLCGVGNGLYGNPVTYALYTGGFQGVRLFFVISGFLIASISLARWGDPHRISPLAFYRMRAARILPGLLIYVALLVLLSVSGIAFFTPPPDKSVATAAWYALTFRYDAIVIQYNGAGMQAWSPIWSLSVEEMFYLVFPLACIVLRWRVVCVAALLALVAIAPWSHAAFGPYSLAGSADALAIGCLAALAADALCGVRLPAWIGPAGRAAGAALVVAVFADPDWRNDTIAMPVVLAAGAGVFLIGNALSARLSPNAAFLSAPLRAIGRRSYEAYLLHMLALPAFMALGTAGSQAEYVARLALYIAVVSLAAEGFGRFVLDPANCALRAPPPSRAVLRSSETPAIAG